MRAGRLRCDHGAGGEDTALDLLADLDVNFHDHQLLAERMWELCPNLTTYDAAYVSLGELLGAPVITTDTLLAHAPGNRARVDPVGANR